MKRYYTTQEVSEMLVRSGPAINYWAKKLGVKGGGGRRKRREESDFWEIDFICF
jgi:hypothetical protein